VNAGFLAAKTARLAAWLDQVKNDNAQGEYYLTDVVGLAVRSGVAVTAVRAADWREVIGVNSRHELAQLERTYQAIQAARLLEGGVALADPARIDVPRLPDLRAGCVDRRQLRVRRQGQPR
jgi:bifunctional UDP-N-acetylglucosamine pyrophosphorylase/glucosamine-1-phosphate N-acetyltransferase